MAGYSSNNSKSKFWSYFIIIVFVLIVVLLGVKRDKLLKGMGSSMGCSKEDIQEAMIDLMREKPELIIQAVNDGQRIQQKKMIEDITQKVEAGMKELEKSDFAPYSGNAEGDVKIYYFYDPNCGYCKISNGTMAKVLAEDKNVMVVYKPLPFLGKDSQDAIKIGIAVYDIDKSRYPDFHNKLMSAARANKQSAMDAVKAMGISAEQIDEYTKKPENQARIDEFMKTSSDLGIRAVPGFIINGDYIPGALDLENFKVKIKEKRAEKSQDEKK